jgi:hypothetical protein
VAERLLPALSREAPLQATKWRARGAVLWCVNRFTCGGDIVPHVGGDTVYLWGRYGSPVGAMSKQLLRIVAVPGLR